MFTTIGSVGTLRVAVSDAPSFGAYTVCLTERDGTCTPLRARSVVACGSQPRRALPVQR